MEQYQFELWTECNSDCKFCYLGTQNKYTSTQKKLSNLEKTYNKICDVSLYNKVDTLGFIGGEFFQGQLSDAQVKQMFLKLMRKCNELLDKRLIKNVWLCATLTIGQQRDLIETLNIFKDNIDKIWVLTSYDTIGRFHTERMKTTWLDNVKMLKNLYPSLNINITTIVTGDFIDKYINEELADLDYALRLGCSHFLKPPAPIQNDMFKGGSKEEVNKILPNFFPTRDKVRTFLLCYKNRESSYMYDKLFNMKYRSSYLQQYDNNGNTHERHRIQGSHREIWMKNEQEESINKCGHSSQYCCYIDTEDCCICDKEQIDKMG